MMDRKEEYMAEKLRPVCGCKIVAADAGKKDAVNGCEPCIISDNSQCGCGCNTVIKEPKKKK